MPEAKRAPRGAKASEQPPPPEGAGPTGNIYQRLLWVEAQLDRVPKTGTAKAGAGEGAKEYAHVEVDVLLAMVRPLFIQAGVYVAFTVTSCEQLERTTRNGTVSDITKLNVAFSFINAAQPDDRFVVVVPGYGYDSLDKGPGKALAYATKNAVLKALLMPSGDEDLEAHGAHAPETEAPQRSQGGSQPTRGNQGGRGRPATAQQPPSGVSLDDLAEARRLATANKPCAVAERAIEWLDDGRVKDNDTLQSMLQHLRGVDELRKLASDALLPPSVRKETTTWLDTHKWPGLDLIEKHAERLHELLGEAENEMEGT